jgi:hypothetical protein
MYLAHEDWSPRFENTFYTITIDGFEKMKEQPRPPTSSFSVMGNTTLPAYYYRIVVRCGHDRHVVWRRYSQFQWLYRELFTTTDLDEEQPPLYLPRSEPCLGCPWRPQDDAFAQTRMDDLHDFLRDALVRRGVARHDAVAKFLELEAFAGKGNGKEQR